MEPSLGLAIKVAVIGLLVLLVVLAALAGIVYLLTRYLVDKKEEAPATEEIAAPAVAEVEEPKSDLTLAAALAVAIARAQAEIQSVATDITTGQMDAWRQFGLQRRLNQSSTIRRTK
ncbi:MAG TPA: OadG family transporter subunit [Anaerolineaceae bacterium]|nr:OadG family transporter subunit [Anaerolineaceae bacterium]